MGGEIRESEIIELLDSFWYKQKHLSSIDCVPVVSQMIDNDMLRCVSYSHFIKLKKRNVR